MEQISEKTYQISNPVTDGEDWNWIWERNLELENVFI